MADFIDIILARAMSARGRIDTYAAKAAKAEEQSTAAVNNITSITEQTQANNELAASTLETANEALENATAAAAAVQEALEGLDVPTTSDIDSEINKLTIVLDTNNDSISNKNKLVITYPDQSTDVVNNIIKMYKNIGNNEDGTMTQKAIKVYVENVANNLQTAINNAGSSGGNSGSVDLGSENAKHIIIVGVDGTITPSSITERSIIEALIKAGVYVVDDALGIEIDYANKSSSHTQDAAAHPNFNLFKMYGGRKRCNVADDGTINAFYGDPGYTEDGSNGQVMVYQPKFYYQRIPIKMDETHIGKIVRKESLLISEEMQAGFKLHPLFINEAGEEVDYVLLSAYEGCIYDVSANSYILNDAAGIDFNADKLSSIANAKPVSGQNNSFTIENAEKVAKNRGTGWHITNMEVDSANQILEMIEYGSLNMQAMIAPGVVNIPSEGTGINMASNTGSTASLGNGTGRAASTINKSNGKTKTYTDADKCAVSYRGMENLWGNIWNFIGGLNVYGDEHLQGGMLYICNNYNYNYETIDNNYGAVGFTLPAHGGYISAMGYGADKYDWVYSPAECADTANSALPVGDSLWVVENLNQINYAIGGGTTRSQDTAGAFYYGYDCSINSSPSASTNARLMFKPTKNAIYTANIEKWTASMGG